VLAPRRLFGVQDGPAWPRKKSAEMKRLVVPLETYPGELMMHQKVE